MTVLRVMVVDDEPLARSLLIRLCESIEDVEVVAQSDTGVAAIHAVRAQQPDLMLLDVELPDMSGFELLHALQGSDMPSTIVVTASASHALSAFEAGAIDYLVKPVRAERFREALRRARSVCERAPAGLAPRSLQTAWELDAQRESPARPRLLAAERERRLYLLDPERIDYIEAYGNYVRIWSASTSYISRDCVKELAQLLAPDGFVRVQRSKLVNLRAVSYIERPGHGVFVFTLSCGARLESTPTYRAEILRAVYSADISKRQGIRA
jgi:two-component system, LytTR family, response regulator